MKGILSEKTYKKIYDLLNKVEHLDYDCGVLCDKICCQKTEPDMGIYLLPNEHLVLREEKDWLSWGKHPVRDYDFPSSWEGETFFISCNSNCPREKRPLQCRTFPLTPHLNQKGKLFLIWETLTLPYLCPILQEQRSLNRDFIKNLYQAWQILITDPLIKDLVVYDSNNRLRQRRPIKIVYPK